MADPKMSRRDESMLGQVYDEIAPRLYGMISEIVPDPATALEILQETFIRLWKDARRLDLDRVSAKVWLTLEARARAVDRRRREGNLDPRALPRLQSLLKSSAWLPGPEEIAQVEERRRLLDRIARGLPRSQTRLVELAVFKGYTETEIAQQLGLPPGRIEGELRAALRFLRHRLGAVLRTWTADI